MTSKEFILDSNRFQSRTLTTLQHKLRVVLKCYTVTDFQLDEGDNSFTFKKSYMIRGVRMNDPKEYAGHYIYQEIEEGKCKVLINVL